MFVCQSCAFVSPSLKLHISHLRLVHREDKNFEVVCGIEGCELKFRAFGAFNSHVYRAHRQALGLNSKYSIPEPGSHDNTQPSLSRPENVDIDIDRDLSDPGHEFEYQYDEQFSERLSNSFVTQEKEASQHQRAKNSALFLLKLREERRVSQVAIADIIAECRRQCEQTADGVLRAVKRKLTQSNIKLEDVEGLDDVLVPDFYENIHTPHLLEKFARDNLNYVVSC